jgi:hypothetical protein
MCGPGGVGGNAQFRCPTGLTIDPARNIYVADRIIIVSARCNDARILNVLNRFANNNNHENANKIF